MSSLIEESCRKKTRWERVMVLFYTKNIASLGMNFAPALNFSKISVTSVTISQYVRARQNSIISVSPWEKTIIGDPLVEMNGVHAWHVLNGRMQVIEVGKDLLPKVISLVNSPSTTIYNFHADVLQRNIAFLNSKAGIRRTYFPNLEEMEKNLCLNAFKVYNDDDMRAPEPVPAHLYFEPKVKKLIELIKKHSDASGKADAEVIHAILMKKLDLGSDEAWAVFDYAARFNIFNEVDQRYAVLTGKTIPSISGHYDNT
jgi:hypothetical protein